MMQFVEDLPSNTSNQPHARSGHRAVATESDLWIWGGYYPAHEQQPERMFEEVRHITLMMYSQMHVSTFPFIVVAVQFCSS
jgi:hypothetical protein